MAGVGGALCGPGTCPPCQAGRGFLMLPLGVGVGVRVQRLLACAPRISSVVWLHVTDGNTEEFAGEGRRLPQAAT